MYNRKLLMMGKGNARNILEFFDKIKFGKFVGLVGFIKKKYPYNSRKGLKNTVRVTVEISLIQFRSVKVSKI